MAKSAIIIGAGLGGIGTAALLAKNGYLVTVVEKNEMPGGRASVFSVTKNDQGKWEATATSERFPDSFRFDMGPSWYLMPDVFEHFFKVLGEDISQHLTLTKLSPSYRVKFKDSDTQVDIFSDLHKDLPNLDRLEPGAGDALTKYLEKSAYQYDVAKNRFMYKNYDSLKDFFTLEMLRDGRKLSVFQTMDRYVRKYFKSPEVQKIMQYPLVFLGSSPYNTPAIYNIMSHIDFNMGVYYPQGGIYSIVEALVKIAESNGVQFRYDADVRKIIVENNKATGVQLKNGETLPADLVISNADIQHTESQLLDARHRQYSNRYWQTRTLAPSALILYLGIRGKLPNLTHHNLLFSKDWQANFKEIFDDPQWPSDPSLYVCKPSATDDTVSPKGHENLFVLVPIASGLDYNNKELSTYADTMIDTISAHFDLPDLKKNIVFQQIFSVKDFALRYNAFHGTALGLAHTLKQTAVYRPNNVHKKVKDLYFVGAGTNPGIGMPITLISAELLYKRLTGDKTAGPLKTDSFTTESQPSEQPRDTTISHF